MHVSVFLMASTAHESNKKAERDEVGTALWSPVCVVVVVVQYPPPNWLTPHRLNPPLGWHPPITLSRDGRGRSAFTLSQRILGGTAPNFPTLHVPAKNDAFHEEIARFW